MDIRELDKLFKQQGQTIIIGTPILQSETARDLRILVGSDHLVVQSAKVYSNVEDIVEERESLKIKKREMKLSPRGVTRPKEVKKIPGHRWDRFASRDLSSIETLNVETAILMFHNRKSTKSCEFKKKPSRRRPFISVEGVHQLSSGRVLKVRAVFRGRPWEAAWEIALSGFPDDFARDVIPALREAANWRSIRLVEPELILASGPFNTMAKSVYVPLEAGINLVAGLNLPPNLRGLAGNPIPCVLCGRIWFNPASPVPIPEVDLASFPRVTFALGLCKLYDGFFSVRCHWVDWRGADPEEAENGSVGDDSGGPALRTEVAAAGTTLIEGLPVLLWSDIAHENCVLTFALQRPMVVVPFSSGCDFLELRRKRAKVPVGDLGSLDAYVGASGWRTQYVYQGSLAQGHPYFLRDLNLFFDLVLQRVVNAAIIVESSRPFMLVGIKGFRLEPYRIGWNIRFTAGQGENPVLITAEGKLHGPDELELDAVLEHPSFTIFASGDQVAVNPGPFSQRDFMQHLRPQLVGQVSGSYTGLYMEFMLGRDGYYIASVGTTADGDNEINWN